MTFAVAACMKNEGAFVAEWVSHYLALGFQKIFVITNDCDDGTDLIVDRLSHLAPVIHIRNEVPEGGFAQEHGMALLKRSDQLRSVSWLLHCDADEMLYLHDEDPDIGNYVSSLPPCDAITFDWRFAGTDLDAWQGGLLIDNCPLGSAKISYAETFSKTMFRPELFGFFSDHMPKAPVRADVVVRNSVGAQLPNTAMFHPRKSRYVRGRTPHLTWERAELRHYALRSKQAFAIKALRGFGIHPRPDKYRVGSRFWFKADRRATKLQENLLLTTRIRKHYESFMADPKIAELHGAAVRAIAEKALHLQEVTGQ